MRRREKEDEEKEKGGSSYFLKVRFRFFRNPLGQILPRLKSVKKRARNESSCSLAAIAFPLHNTTEHLSSFLAPL